MPFIIPRWGILGVTAAIHIDHTYKHKQILTHGVSMMIKKKNRRYIYKYRTNKIKKRYKKGDIKNRDILIYLNK